MYVRLAIESDTDAIVEMARINWAQAQPNIPFDEDVCRATIAKSLRTASPTIFVVDERRDVIAFLLAAICDYRAASGQFTTQEILFVRPDKRGTRAAVILMNQLIAWSKMLGAKEIIGGNDNDFKSERTSKFLAHFGFERVGYEMRRVL